MSKLLSGFAAGSSFFCVLDVVLFNLCYRKNRHRLEAYRYMAQFVIAVLAGLAVNLISYIAKCWIDKD
ncbi:hypothetical protein WOSG25_020510 [Weissella oryzae SG25]|uniref:Uncharacterized protein n=1 Tax=Weissella oryzae (strain DSM 25784 / JCM 18191 / LMG 30913 / SG25) TaxID=1329250 RepID=A0A069CS55_WEIOS|nr:hypothetical protein WOSG25_020510 [Weissella oryzae SG25]